jgi:hypothetical protein
VIAALRDFERAYVGCGSLATDRYDTRSRGMSASRPIGVYRRAGKDKDRK